MEDLNKKDYSIKLLVKIKNEFGVCDTFIELNTENMTNKELLNLIHEHLTKGHTLKTIKCFKKVIGNNVELVEFKEKNSDSR